MTIQERYAPTVKNSPKEISNTILLIGTAEIISEAAAKISTILLAPPQVVCKTTTADTINFNVHTNKIVQLNNISACKTSDVERHPMVPDNLQLIESACKIADTTKTSESICKRIDIVDQYFSNEDKPSKKANIVK